MSSWPTDTLQAIAESDDPHIAPFRDDGTTPGTLTWIRPVVVDGDLHVRACNGTRWYRAAVRQHAGRIRAAGTLHEVALTPAAPAGRSPMADLTALPPSPIRTRSAAAEGLEPRLCARSGRRPTVTT